MKKAIVLIISLTFMVGTSFSQTFDPAYTNKFGYGVILASSNGYPAFDKFDESQFNFKDNKFMFPVGEETTIDLRYILPQGMTLGSLISKLKKEKPQKLSKKTAEYSVWSIWLWHNEGTKVMDANLWPKKKTDVPLWSEPLVNIIQGYDQTVATRNTGGLQWAEDGGNLKFEMGSTLKTAVPGDKFYITYRVAYEYSVPGGEHQQKWDSDLNKWVDRISTDGIGYIYSDPVAVGIVEIDAYDDPTGRFVDNGNGTVTDKKANLMWVKTPPSQKMYWEDAQKYATSFDLAGYKDWRLPNLNELKVMMKISKIKDQMYECKWLNENGFSQIQAKPYWCGDAYMRNGSESGKNVVDFETKTLDGKEINYEFCCWLVRTIK
jgi:hypothetical protein